MSIVLRKPGYFVRRAIFYLFLCFIALICVLPLYWMVRASFMRNIDILILYPFLFWPAETLWQNYVDTLRLMNFTLYLTNTLIILFGALAGVLLTSSMAAYAFSRVRWVGRELCFAIILSTMMLPGTVTIISQYLLWARVGAIDTFVPLILPAWFGGGAFNIFLLRQFFMNIPRELDEAAVVDGAGNFRVFFSIILPLSKSALIVVALFTFMGTWNDFFGPLLFLHSRENFTLALGLLQFRGEFVTRWNFVMAGSTVVILPCILVFALGQKRLTEGISLTGIKG